MGIPLEDYSMLGYLRVPLEMPKWIRLAAFDALCWRRASCGAEEEAHHQEAADEAEKDEMRHTAENSWRGTGPEL